MCHTYKELVSDSYQPHHYQESLMSNDTEESKPLMVFGCQRVGFMLGQNSLGNWSIIQDDDNNDKKKQPTGGDPS